MILSSNWEEAANCPLTWKGGTRAGSFSNFSLEDDKVPVAEADVELLEVAYGARSNRGQDIGMMDPQTWRHKWNT